MEGVSPNTCIHPCPTLGELIESIHHSDWINLPFEDTGPLYTKLSQSDLPNSSSLLFSLSLFCFFVIRLSSLNIFSKSLRAERKSTKYVNKEARTHSDEKSTPG